MGTPVPNYSATHVIGRLQDKRRSTQTLAWGCCLATMASVVAVNQEPKGGFNFDNCLRCVTVFVAARRVETSATAVV